jgi:acyl-CoA dehydrogenase
MEEAELLDPFERLLAHLFPLDRLREAEAGRDAGRGWSELADSGFLDVLVSEAAGGAGLTLRDAGPLIEPAR